MDFAKIKTETRDVYVRKANFWHNRRDRSGYENIWLDRFLEPLPKSGHILDLACGTGDPIAAYVLGRGYSVTGVDYAPTMIEIAEQTYPACKWVVADIADLPDLGQFDGMLSWDGFFHLSAAQQRLALPQYAKRIHAGGSLLLTVGTEEGEVIGHIEDETVYHASLAPTDYAEILRGLGFSNVIYQAEDPQCLGRSILLATDLKVG